MVPMWPRWQPPQQPRGSTPYAPTTRSEDAHGPAGLLCDVMVESATPCTPAATAGKSGCGGGTLATPPCAPLASLVELGNVQLLADSFSTTPSALRAHHGAKAAPR